MMQNHSAPPLAAGSLRFRLFPPPAEAHRKRRG